VSEPEYDIDLEPSPTVADWLEPDPPDRMPVTAATVTGTRREAILAHLAGHPDLTAHELARAIGAASTVTDLLRDMETKAQVASRLVRRAGQGRPVHLWRIAPPGTVPPLPTSRPAELAARRREQDNIARAARRARARARVPFTVSAALPDAACRGADPALFFPQPGDTEAEAAAVAICMGCPARAVCYAGAVQRGEGYGIWGAVNLETTTRRPAAAG
jgi:Transcription factor WhiB